MTERIDLEDLINGNYQNHIIGNHRDNSSTLAYIYY